MYVLNERGHSLFCAAFVILLGFGIGLGLGYHEPTVVHFAQERFDASAINMTATAVQQTLEERPDGPVVAPAVFVLLFLVNNGIVAALITFNHRFLLPVQSLIITVGALFMNGLIFGVLLMREAMTVGALEVARIFGSYGGIEMAAYIMAGALGFYAISHGYRHLQEERIFVASILPLLFAAAAVETMFLFS